MGRFQTLMVTTLLAGCAATLPTAEHVSPPAYRIIAYARSTDRMDLGEIDARRLTHVNYAFADVENDEIVLRRPGDAVALAKLTQLRAVNPDLKVLLSVGGWSWSGNFSDAALTDSSRARFARSGAHLVQVHGLDGIDLDWEYPGLPGAGNVHRPEDRANFTLLLQSLREHLDGLAARSTRTEPYLLTIAAGAGEAYLRNTEMGRVAGLLDFINLMTYDFYGGWSDRTGHHSNLHPSACGELSASRAVERYMEEGVPADKIVLGAAFYGRSWTGVHLAGSGLCQTYETDAAASPFSSLAEKPAEGYIRIWDSQAMAPYLVHPDSGRFITYDDASSVQFKALYVRELGLGGVMFWAYDHDPEARLLRVLHAYLAH